MREFCAFSLFTLHVAMKLVLAMVINFRSIEQLTDGPPKHILFTACHGRAYTMRVKQFIFTFLASILVSHTPARAETPGEACDRLATQSLIKTKPASVKGVAYDDIDAPAAMKACAEAITASPDIKRYHIQYGRSLNKAGRFADAIAQYEEAKKAGHWEANVFISDMYFFGDFGKVDYEKAFALTLEAAEHDVASAAGSVGIWYRDALGTSKDLNKSLSWLRKAYELGYADAAVDIGWAHENGLAVAVDYREAMRWYEIGSRSGNMLAMNNIGALYGNGLGVPKDNVKALVWYRKAQSLGNPLAYINIAGFTDSGTATDKNPALAAEYVIKAFDLGTKWDDPRNRDTMYKDRWSPEFWRVIQTELKKRGHYTGPIDGVLNQATKDAFEKIVDK